MDSKRWIFFLNIIVCEHLDMWKILLVNVFRNTYFRILCRKTIRKKKKIVDTFENIGRVTFFKAACTLNCRKKKITLYIETFFCRSVHCIWKWVRKINFVFVSRWIICCFIEEKKTDKNHILETRHLSVTDYTLYAKSVKSHYWVALGTPADE